MSENTQDTVVTTETATPEVTESTLVPQENTEDTRSVFEEVKETSPVSVKGNVLTINHPDGHKLAQAAAIYVQQRIENGGY
jgi:hypothetical protein